MGQAKTIRSRDLAIELAKARCEADRSVWPGVPSLRVCDARELAIRIGIGTSQPQTVQVTSAEPTDSQVPTDQQALPPSPPSALNEVALPSFAGNEFHAA